MSQTNEEDFEVEPPEIQDIMGKRDTAKRTRDIAQIALNNAKTPYEKQIAIVNLQLANERLEILDSQIQKLQEREGGRRSHRRKRSSRRKSHHKRASHRKSHHKRRTHRKHK